MPAIPAIAIAVTVAAAATAAVATYSQAQAQSKASAYNAQMEQYNSEIQRQQGQVDAQSIEEQGEVIQGKARAAAAASGLSGGSSDDIQYVDLVRNDQQALAMKYRGDIGAYNADSQANLDQSAASNAKVAGGLGAGGALLSGASGALGQANTNYGGSAIQPVFGSTSNINLGF